jgi:hypothetical protein
MVLHPLRRLLPLLLLGCVLALTAPSRAQVGVSITIAPPALPVYVEPPLPADGYIFTPGYWAWGPGGYYWVPGTWVLPPAPGLLWTPGYWAFIDAAYVWHAGYWGPHIGYYGGVNYGFGYFGHGYDGGRWEDGHFFYNSAVHNFGGVHVVNVYRQAVPAYHGAPVGFAGGPHGIAGGPRPEEEAAGREEHQPPSELQARHESGAGNLPHAFANVNHGRPQVAATPQPANFTGHGIVAARSAPHYGGGGHPAPGGHGEEHR